MDTYGNDSENFRKRHRDAPRHRAENLRLGKSDSRDGAVADARDDFNTLPGIDDDSASTGSIGGFSMGSLGESTVAFLYLPSPCNAESSLFNWKMQVGRRLFCLRVCHPKIASVARERDEARLFTVLNLTILTAIT